MLTFFQTFCYWPTLPKNYKTRKSRRSKKIISLKSSIDACQAERTKFLKKNCSKNCVKTLRDEFLRSPDKNLWFVSFSKTSLKSPIALKTPIRIMFLFPFHCLATSPPQKSYINHKICLEVSTLMA